MVGGYAGLGTRARRPVPGRPPRGRRPRRARRLDRRGGRRAAAAGRRRDGGDRPGRRDHAGRRAARSRAATTSPTRSPRSPSGLLFGVAPDAIRRAAAAFTGVEHRLAAGRPRRRRAVRQRLPGHPARRRHRRAARVRAAGRADRRRPRQGRRPHGSWPRSPARRVDAAVLIGESGPALERAAARRRRARTAARRGRWTRPSRPPTRWPATPSRPGPPGTVATVLLSPAAASFDMFEDYAARGRAFIAAVGRLAEATMSTTPMTAVRRTRARGAADGSRGPRSRSSASATSPSTGSSSRSSPSPPSGILMVYSSSAMKAFLQTRRHVRDRRAADPVGRAGDRRDGRDDADRLPLAARRVGAAVRHRRRQPDPRVRARRSNIVVGGSARWLKIGPLPAVHPAEFMKLALVVYLAHWFAKRGSAVRGLLGAGRCRSS